MAWYEDPVTVTTMIVVIIAAVAIVIFAMRRTDKITPKPPKKNKKEVEVDQSLAFRKKFVRFPVVDLWCKLLAEKLNIFENCNMKI